MLSRRCQPPTYLYVAVALMLGLYLVLPGPQLISFPWNLFGSLPFATGVLLNIVADRIFKRRSTTVKSFQNSTALVSDGVFGISRNPMYLGMVLMLLGIAVFLGKLTPFIVVLAFPFVLERAFISVEERMLEDEFGDAWREYRSRVRRWI